MRPEPRFKARFEQSPKKETSESCGLNGRIFDESNPFPAVLAKNQRVTADDHFQDTRLIEFDLAESGITYSPGIFVILFCSSALCQNNNNDFSFPTGDVCMIQPRNSNENVEFFFDLFPNFSELRYRKFDLVPDKNARLPPAWRGPYTLQECAETFFDLQAVPKRFFFELLSHFADDDLESEKLTEFFSAEGQQERFDYCNRPRRNILEVNFRIDMSKLFMKVVAFLL